MISYQKLWVLLKERGITQSMLRREYGITPQCISALKEDRYVRTALLDKLCLILSCDVSEILERKEDAGEI
ncbi:MAG: helix-turn-helix transcriptional regulator [Eubacteriales bacterium]|nr:helix-turn-helix transcriptional regulator [Eubacteriales bacterium]